MLEEWIRGMTAQDDGKTGFMRGKKAKYLLVILICLGLLVLIWPTTSIKPQVSESGASKNSVTAGSTDNTKAQLRDELAAILAQVEGAGKVEVSLMLTSEGVKTFAANTRDESRNTHEIDRQGVEKKIVEQNVVQELAVSGGQALLVEQKYPEVVGVLVVADGANDPVIREKLINATATLLNISSYKVEVMPRSFESEKE